MTNKTTVVARKSMVFKMPERQSHSSARKYVDKLNPVPNTKVIQVERVGTTPLFLLCLIWCV